MDKLKRLYNLYWKSKPLKFKVLVIVVVLLVIGLFGYVYYKTAYSPGGSDSWRAPGVYQKKYLEVVTNAVNDDEYFQTFKQEYYYKTILEHTTKAQGDGYLSYISSSILKDAAFMQKIELNTVLGGPTIYQFSGIEKKISPSQLRYTKVLSDLETYFGSLKNKSIVEIGIGYGGQCNVIFARGFPKLYSLFDLPPVVKLGKKYLSKFPWMPMNRVKLEDFTVDTPSDKTWDLVISNYAYSETPFSVQDRYFENVLSKSTHGYLTLNWGESDRYQELMEKLRKLGRSPKQIEETPKTYSHNIIVIW